VTVDPATAVSFVLYAPGQDVSMAVISSQGQEIRPETVPTLPGVTLQRDGAPGITGTEGFRIQRPAAGTWQVLLAPRAGAQTDGAFWAVAVFVQSDLQLTAETRPSVARAGESIEVRAALTGPVDPGGTTVSAVIRDATGRVVGEVPLFDDGAHGDDGAGDGVFAARWTANAPGLYSVTLTAAGRRGDGAAFQRVTAVAIQVN
jgi:hypothetical protein